MKHSTNHTTKNVLDIQGLLKALSNVAFSARMANIHGKDHQEEGTKIHPNHECCAVFSHLQKGNSFVKLDDQHDKEEKEMNELFNFNPSIMHSGERIGNSGESKLHMDDPFDRGRSCTRELVLQQQKRPEIEEK